MERRAFTERVLPRAFVPLMGSTLSVWAGFLLCEAMGYQASWPVLVLPACALLGVAFAMDAASTIKFGRQMIVQLEAAPLLRAVTSRYGLACGVVSQLAFEVALAAGVVLLVGHAYGHLLPAHHLAAGIALTLAVCHYTGWRSNNRYWGRSEP